MLKFIRKMLGRLHRDELVLVSDTPKFPKKHEFLRATDWRVVLTKYSSGWLITPFTPIASPIDNHAKWNLFQYMKKVGLEATVETFKLDGITYKATAKVANTIAFSGIAADRTIAQFRALRILVSFIGNVCQLQKDFIKHYKPEKSKVKLVKKLAALHPKLLQISQAGCDRRGYSTSICIKSVLEYTEAAESLAISMEIAASKVVRYLKKLAEINHTQGESQMSSLSCSKQISRQLTHIISMRTLMVDFERYEYYKQKEESLQDDIAYMDLRQSNNDNKFKKNKKKVIGNRRCMKSKHVSFN